MRSFCVSLRNGLVLAALCATNLLAESTVTVSELEKTSATEGSLLVKLNTTDAATAFETEFVFDPKKVDVTSPGSLQVPGADDAEFSVDSYNVTGGRLRVVLSSARLKTLPDGTTFRVPVRAAKGVAKMDAFFPVAVSEMALSDNSGKGAKPKLGTSLRIKSFDSGAKVDGKPGVTLGLELLKDDSQQVSKVEYFANGKLITSGNSVAGLSWTPPGSGAFQLSARVTMADGTKSTSSTTPVIITGVGTTPVKGTYAGAVSDSSSQKAAAGTGTVQISTTSTGAKGSYSMRLVLNGTALVASGKFDSESVATPSITVRTGGAQKTYRVRFQQEATGFSDAISGVVTDGTLSVGGEPSGGSFASSFVANRNVWSGSNTTGAVAGKYTMTLPLMDDFKDAPLGTALVTLSPLGLVTGKFFLNDGSRITASGVVSKEGIWQPYASLYLKTGFLAGQVDFSDKGQTGWVSGDLDWRQDAGTLSNLDALGGVYVAPVRGAVLAVKAVKSNIAIAIAEGGLTEPITQAATLTSTNIIQIPTPNLRRMVLRVDRTSGALTGSFMAPGDTVATPVNGVVFQAQKKAVGYFTRKGQTGTIEITAVP